MGVSSWQYCARVWVVSSQVYSKRFTIPRAPHILSPSTPVLLSCGSGKTLYHPLYAMLSNVVAILFFAYCTLAAPTSPQCSTIRAVPPPTDATCENTQALVKPLGAALLSRRTISDTIVHPFNQCRRLCSNTVGCLSFAYNDTNRACRLYKQSLSNVGLKAGTTQSSIRKDDLACFTTTCASVSATNTASPTSTSLVATSSSTVVPTCTRGPASPTLTALTSPTTLVAASSTGVTYNIPQQQVSVPWGFQLYGQTIDTLNMNGFGVSHQLPTATYIADLQSELTNAATHDVRWRVGYRQQSW